jgi:hypothetical protein
LIPVKRTLKVVLRFTGPLATVAIAGILKLRFGIACATGYNIVFPFLDKSIVDLSGKTEVGLWRKMFHPHYHNLYFIGLFQPLGCIWPLADFQAKLACQEILGKYERPSNIGKAIDKEIKKPHYKFVRSPRHSTEVDYPRFRRELLTEIRKCRP